MTTLRVGYIPYRNMTPFHHGFGPAPIEKDGLRMEFPAYTPRLLGMDAEKGRVDAGAFSLVDAIRLSDPYEPLGDYGIGVKGPAQSVLLFSRTPLAQFSGFCSVSDETATSVRLLEMLLRVRYGIQNFTFGRIASSLVFDGVANGLLLIGDEALQAKKEGVPGFPIVIDLGQEWLDWQGTPFAFARWMVRRSLPAEIKTTLTNNIENSLNQALIQSDDYLSGFQYRLTSAHTQSMSRFSDLLSSSSPAASPSSSPAASGGGSSVRQTSGGDGEKDV